jgi:hypothetical protein
MEASGWTTAKLGKRYLWIGMGTYLLARRGEEGSDLIFYL